MPGRKKNVVMALSMAGSVAALSKLSTLACNILAFPHSRGIGVEMKAAFLDITTLNPFSFHEQIIWSRS